MKPTMLQMAASLAVLTVLAPPALAAMPTTPPRWAVGSFRGTNRKYNLNVDLTIDDRGIIKRWTWKRTDRRNDSDYAEGGWESGEIVFVGDRFRVDRTGSGFTATKMADKNDITDFRRVGSGSIPDRSPIPDRVPRFPDRTPRLPDRDPRSDESRVPAWATGPFRGPNRKYNLDVELRISRLGTVDRSIWKDRSNKPDTSSGRWEDGEIVFGRDHYTVSQTRDGIRTEKRGDKSDVTNLRRR